MRKKILTSLSIIAGIALLLFVFIKIGISDIIKALSLLSLSEFLFFIAFFFGEFLLHAYRWKLVLKLKGHDIPFIRLIPFRMAGFAVSYLTPMSRVGGEPVRAYLLKKECGLGFGEGLSSVFIDKIIEWSAAMTFLLIGMVFLFTNYALPKSIQAYLLVLWIVLASGMFLFYHKASKNEHFFTTLLSIFRIDRIEMIKKMHQNIKWFDTDVAKFFIENKNSVIGLLFFSMVIQFGLLIMYQTIILFLGFKINLLYAILILVFVSFATIIPAPASLGFYEGFAAVIFVLLGLGAEVGVAFSLLIRAAELIITGIGMFFLSFFGVKFSGIDRNNSVVNSLK